MTRSAPILALTLLATLRASPARAGDTRACDTAYDQAQTLRDAKKLIAARDQLRVCASAACPAFMVRDCATWLGDIEPRIPSVLLVASDATGTVLPSVTASIDGGTRLLRLDGTSTEVDAGPHTFAFVAADGRRVERSVVVLEGTKNQRVGVTFATQPTLVTPPPPLVPPVSQEDPGHGRRVAGFVVGGAGLAGVAVGALFGAFTFSAWSSVNSLCRTHSGCSPTAVTDHDHAVTFGTVSDVGFIAGGLLLAGGLTLYITAPSHASPIVGFRVTPDGVEMTGRF